MKRDRKLEFFEKNLDKLNKDDQNAYTNKEKQLVTDEIFLRKQLTGTQGLIEFINENDIQKNCVTNLSKGRIPGEKNLVVDMVGIRYGYSAISVPAELVAYTNTIFSLNDTEFDAGAVATGGEVYSRLIHTQIQNAEYEIRHDGGIIDRGRISDLLTHNVTVDGVNGHEKNYRMLEWPKMLLAEKKLEMNIRFPESGPVLPGFHYIELVMKGLGLSKRQG